MGRARARRTGGALATAGGDAVKPAHALEYAAVRVLAATARGLGRRGALALGTALGAALGALGVRGAVARANLARAFPELSQARREEILAAHYRELGRVALEYPQHARLAAAPDGEVIAAVRGFEHIENAARGGRGALFMSGHFGNFELMAAWTARRVPIDLLVRPLSNPGVDRWLTAVRAAAGLGSIRADVSVREAFAAIRAGRSLALLADQDARRHGVFVPFMGVPASTPVGPARMALALGVPIVMGFCWRRADGRHEIDYEPPLVEAGRGEEAVRRLTARHTERLTEWVRRKPEMWFWLHRRWKTAPPAPAAAPRTGEEPA